MPLIDARRIVQEFQGPKHLQRRLTADGHQITLKAIEQWITRGRIPSDWLAVLSLYAASDGRQFLLHDYVLPDDDEKSNTAPRDFLD